MEKITFKEFIGTLEESDNRIKKTDKGVFTDFSMFDLDDIEDAVVSLYDSKKEGEYSIHSLSIREVGKEYSRTLGNLLMKEGEPYILSSIPGDEREANIFNNTFISSGHDGSYYFDIKNPENFMNGTW